MDKINGSQSTYSNSEIRAKPWVKIEKPKRILVIRLQATGDMVVALPYIQFLKRSLPEHTIIDFLIRDEAAAIARHLELFDNVYSWGGKRRSVKKQSLRAVAMLPRLLMRRYDVVIDLQNNEITRMVRKVLMPKAWSEFDRFSAIPAGERYRLTIEAAGLGPNAADNNFTIKPIPGTAELLYENGWNGISDIVIINPAAAFKTRNWPIANYAEFMKLWLGQRPQTQFLIIGVGIMADKATYLKEELGDHLINLVNKTRIEQAIAIVQQAKIMLSEDSGLMHMAWVLGIPTMAMFGGTRSDWARPLGPHTDFVDSSDLSCGNCMLKICSYGDNHCMTRYTPGFIFDRTNGLLNSLVQEEMV